MSPILKVEKIEVGKIEMLKSEKGIALVTVVAITLILTILGFSVLNIVHSEIALAQDAVDRTKAFYLAEAGIELFSAQLSSGVRTGIGETILGEGSYQVTYVPGADPPYAISTGSINGHEKRIRIEVTFLAPPFECGIYAGGLSGEKWTLMLRGTGDPVVVGFAESGGRDAINGNIFVDGDVALYEESSVNPPLAPNTYGLAGDAVATGDIDVYDSASISGDVNEGAPAYDTPDLVGMNYAVNNTHNVSQIFTDAGINKGYLPNGHELRNVFVKNPPNRNAECGTTTGDDFFFEPSSGFVTGGPHSGDTPIHAGENRVYYIDGDLWVHSGPTYGFKMDGRVTIVATGDIHICDNLEYADANSILGLVALGKYDGDGELISGGNIYFGDPVWGNMGLSSAMMFAANDFLFNTNPITTRSAEPDSGFVVNGSFAALNKVSVDRDWYNWWDESESDYVKKPARYDAEEGKWVDTETGDELTSTEISTLRHYQMIVNYDERVRNRSTQPPGLPRGVGLIFDGLSNWEELP